MTNRQQAPILAILALIAFGAAFIPAGHADPTTVFFANVGFILIGAFSLFVAIIIWVKKW
jgi:hypothetical protein